MLILACNVKTKGFRLTYYDKQLQQLIVNIIKLNQLK